METLNDLIEQHRAELAVLYVARRNLSDDVLARPVDDAAIQAAIAEARHLIESPPEVAVAA